ncbi:MAG: hypothetical protein VW270_25730 [Candidatus Poseidoniales archaeon]
MQIKIILTVDADELDWGNSQVFPSDNCEGQVVLDFDLDRVKYQGQEVDFVDTDQACDYLEFLWGEADHKEYGHG